MAYKSVNLYRNCKINFSFLIELFLLLGFFRVTYTYNIYIFYGIAVLPFFLYKRQTNFLFLVLFFILLSLIVPYLFVHDSRSAFRVLKTAVIFLPVLALYSLKKFDFKLTKLFQNFMFLSALLVCIDFFLYFLTGRMLMGGTESGFLPRPRGLMEDSNFFSYLMLVYIFYLKDLNGKFNVFFVLSLFLSGSFAAILCFIVLALFGPFINRFNDKRPVLLKNVTMFFTAVLFFFYFNIAFNYNRIMEGLGLENLDGVQQVKYASLMMRFGAQNEALMMLDSTDKIMFGIGAGNTKSLTERGMNLHNTYLQLFLEQGFFIFFIFFIFLVGMVLGIKNPYYVIVFCVIFMLGTILEVFYFPLLSFVFFISFITYQKKSINELPLV